MKMYDFFNGLTLDATPDPAADHLMSRDNSAGALKKILLSSLAPADGWIPAGETWTYASADDPTFTFTIAGVDLTGKYQPGMRIKLTQTSAKYFIITAVAFSTNTTITIYGGTDYDLANAAITSPFYSTAKAPFGFPLSPAKWTQTFTDTTNTTQATPSSGTWYNIATATLSIPIGVWQVSYHVIARLTDTTTGLWDVQTTLSTANNSESDNEFTCSVTGNSVLVLEGPMFKTKLLTLAAKTSYFLNTRTNLANLDSLANRNAVSPCRIHAVCAYL